jgi:hypothetical protein
MSVRQVHFRFTKGPNVPAAHDHFLIRPLARNISGATVNLSAWDRVTLDGNGEATCTLIVTEEGSAAGYEVKEAPGELASTVAFAIPPGDSTLEYSEALPPEAGAFLYDLTGGADFPADAPIGSQGVDYDNGNIYSKGL